MRVCLAVSLALAFLLFALAAAQRLPVPPTWEERSPALGEKVPEVKVHDEELNEVSLSDLYKRSELLVMQWGGCT